MDVLIVIPELAGNGGMESVIRILGQGLEGNGVDYKIYVASKTSRLKYADTSWLGGLPYIRKTAISKEKWIYITYHAWALAAVIRKTNVKRLMTTSSRGILICKLASKLSGARPEIYFWPHRSIHTIKDKKYIKLADRYLAISLGIAEQLKAAGAISDDIKLVYNPIPASHKASIPFNGKNIIFVGRLVEHQKRVSDILQAIAGLDGDWTLHLVGSGADADKLEDLSERLGIQKRVKFHGFQADAWRYIDTNIREVGALVLSSRWEGFPMVLLEAMAYGIYCISSDCETGPSEVIVDGVNGTLYPVGDIASLSDAIRKVLNGKVSCDQSKIRESVRRFGAEEYVSRFIRCLYG